MEPKNLLLIMSDEHDPRYMGVSGHPLVKTPAIDRLAASGTRFTNAYTPCPICVPARASFATGQYVNKIRYWDNAIAYEGAVPGWGHRLQQAGIRHDTIGKLHYRREQDPLGIDNQYSAMHIMDGIGQVWGSIRDPLPKLDRSRKMFKKIGAGVSNYNLFDRGVADRACRWLKARAGEDNGQNNGQNKGQPWVLYLGFVAPHFPFVVPREYLDLYPLDSLPIRKLLPQNGYQYHPWIEAKLAFKSEEENFADEEERLLAIAAYYGLCTFVDAQIGLVLDALKDYGLNDTTRILYTSDHGDNLGARGLWGKSVLYQESTSIPMILSGPDVPQDNVSHTPVNLIDCYQTVLDCVGLPEQEQEQELPGASMFALANSADQPERVTFSEYHAIGAVSGASMLRKGKYKYHYYVGLPPELFDLDNDPEETMDLAGDPDYAAVLADCERELRKIVDPEATDVNAKADQAALIEKFGGREKALTTGTQGATPVPGLENE